jgi:uncharacterized protein (DUF3084 family)
MEQKQHAEHEQRLQELRQQQDSLRAAHDSLREHLMSIHTALSPQSLQLVLGAMAAGGLSLSLSPEAHEQLSSRLLSGKLVASRDAGLVAGRVRDVLNTVGICG